MLHPLPRRFQPFCSLHSKPQNQPHHQQRIPQPDRQLRSSLRAEVSPVHSGLLSSTSYTHEAGNSSWISSGFYSAQKSQRTHVSHALAKKQMRGFGSMLAFDRKGGLPAAQK